MLVIFFSAMASPLLKRMKKKQKKFVLQFSSLTLIDAENAVLMHRNDLIYALKLRIHSEVLGLRFRSSATMFFYYPYFYIVQ